MAESEETRVTDAEVKEVGDAIMRRWNEGWPANVSCYDLARAALEAAAALHPPREGAEAEIRKDLEYLKSVFEGNVAYPQNGPLASAVRRLTDHLGAPLTDRFQPIRDELRRYPELPRFTLSRGTVTDLVEALATTEAALAESREQNDEINAQYMDNLRVLTKLADELAESRGEVERLRNALEQIANYESDADTHLTFRRIANRALSKVALEAPHKIEFLERYREALERILDVSPWGSDQYAMAREALEAE